MLGMVAAALAARFGGDIGTTSQSRSDGYSRYIIYSLFLSNYVFNMQPTGSGKTLAFLLPVFAELLSDSFDSAASCDLATQATALSVPDTAVSAVPVAAAKTATSAVATSASSFDAAVKAEAMAAMRVTATAVFAREIGAGRTPEEAHAIGASLGDCVCMSSAMAMCWNNGLLPRNTLHHLIY